MLLQAKLDDDTEVLELAYPVGTGIAVFSHCLSLANAVIWNIDEGQCSVHTVSSFS